MRKEIIDLKMQNDGLNNMVRDLKTSKASAPMRQSNSGTRQPSAKLESSQVGSSQQAMEIRKL